jgi:hypothetical protein
MGDYEETERKETIRKLAVGRMQLAKGLKVAELPTAN